MDLFTFKKKNKQFLNKYFKNFINFKWLNKKEKKFTIKKLSFLVAGF